MVENRKKLALILLIWGAIGMLVFSMPEVKQNSESTAPYSKTSKENQRNASSLPSIKQVVL